MKSEIVNVEEIQELIVAFANGDFSKRLKVTSDFNIQDSIVSGINMLGEELEQTTISRDYFGSIYNAVSDLLFVTDLNFCITDLNQTSIEKLGFSRDDLNGKDARCLVVDEFGILNEVVQLLETSLIQPLTCESIFKAKLGKTLIAQCVISPIFNRLDELQGYLIIGKDITEQKRQAKEILKIVVTTQEKERSRIAHDLHDSLGQELNAVKMYLNAIAVKVEGNEGNLEIFEQCKLMLQHSIENLRRVSYDIMPAVIELSSLSFALIELFLKMKPLIRIEHNLTDLDICFEKSTEIIIFRVFQEFINNSMKYGDGATIYCTVETDNNLVYFKLRDDGPGFDFSTYRPGNGIQNIKTRLQAINAKFDFRSEPGKGVMLTFYLDHENR